MEIQFGDIKIEIPYEKYWLKHSMENPFGMMFSKSNHDFFNTFFKRMPVDYANYFEEYRRCMEKFIKMSKPDKSEESMK